MGTLFIDTSSKLAFIGLDELIFFENARDISLYAKTLNLTSVTKILVGIGPGTFTGTRIGVMFGLSLAFALKVPVGGFCSLKRLPPPGNGPFQSVSDAKSRGFYTLQGELKNEALSYGSPLLVPEIDPSIPITSELPSIEHLKNIPHFSKINLVY